jgi:hypothetical protein
VTFAEQIAVVCLNGGVGRADITLVAPDFHAIAIVGGKNFAVLKHRLRCAIDKIHIPDDEAVFEVVAAGGGVEGIVHAADIAAVKDTAVGLDPQGDLRVPNQLLAHATRIS